MGLTLGTWNPMVDNSNDNLINSNDEISLIKNTLESFPNQQR